jgi:hypothetical protein
MSDPPLEKLTVPVLKKKCKEAGVAQAGEKPDLINRLKQHAQGEKCKLDGEKNPATLKAGELKKALATRGLPCSLDLESRDVLVGRLIDALKSEGGGSGGGDGGGGGSSGAAGAGDPASSDADEAIALAVGMAKQVLDLAGDAAGVLSLLGAPITRDSPFAQQRKAYLSLSRMIHPDKLSRHFDGATRAFQELVRAFDELTAPPVIDDTPAAKKSTTIARSNQGCYRTKVFCPRCNAEWGTADSGLEKYDYDLMMQGLKLYCCARCLCEFGCVSAKHRCPFCNGVFGYHPRDFHRQINCGNKKCVKSGATFGFRLTVIPPRVEAELRVQIKAEQERRLKAREANDARQARAARKQPALSDGERMKQAEKCFVRGLLDACPRCGFEPPPGVKAEDLESHLKSCTDSKAHAAHKKAVEAAEQKAAAKASVKDAEAEAQNLMAWNFLGGSTEQMWLLTDTQLSKQCEERGLHEVNAGTSREEMLVALAQDQQRRAGQKTLTGPASSSGAAGSSGEDGGRPAKRLRAESLPDNLHGMSLSQLKAVCASHGMLAKGTSCDEVIREIEAALYTGTEAAPLLLE